MTWPKDFDGQRLNLGGQRSVSMRGVDTGMSAIQRIRPRPPSDKFSVSKFCLHSQKLSQWPDKYPGAKYEYLWRCFQLKYGERRGCWKASNMHSEPATTWKKVKSETVFRQKVSQNKSTSSQLSVKLQLWGTIAHSQLLAVWTSRAGEFCHNLWLMWVLTILLLSLTNMKIFKRWLMTIFPAQPQKTSFERGGSRDAFESEDTTGRTSRRWNKAKVRGSEIMYLGVDLEKWTGESKKAAFSSFFAVTFSLVLRLQFLVGELVWVGRKTNGARSQDKRRSGRRICQKQHLLLGVLAFRI